MAIPSVRLALSVLALTACTQATEPAAAAEPGDAEGLLVQSAKAYQKSALQDVMNLEVTAPGRPPQKVKVDYAFGVGRDAMVRMPGLMVTALGDRLYVVRDDVKGKYVDVPLQGDIGETLDRLLGQSANLPATFDLRAGRGVPAYLQSLGLNLLQAPRLDAHRRATLDGRDVHELDIVGTNGQSTAVFDGETLLLRRVMLEVTPQGAPATQIIQAKLTFDPKLKSPADGLIAFDAAGRTSVDSFRGLVPTPARAGDVAPDFTLTSSDGRTITLSELRGQVVILDFWATWCGPCRRGLPYLQKFYDWTRETSQPVAVFGVDCFERAPDGDAKKAKGLAYWTAQNFTMPTLFDLDDTAVSEYGITSIPTTVVVGPDGVIHKVHKGFDPKMDETLKAEVATLMPAGG